MPKAKILKPLLELFILFGLGAPICLKAEDLGSRILKSSGDSPAIRLSLEAASELALNNSLDIQIARFDAYIEETALEKAESIFDTIFDAQISYNRDKKEPLSTLAGTETKEHVFSAGLEKKIPTGTTLSLDLSGTKNRTDSGFSALNPYNEALLEISLTQELGRNFFGLADRSEIKLTKLDIENSQFTSLDDIEQALSGIQQSYWDLVLKSEELSIKKDMLAEAQKLYNIYQDKASLGLVEESELLAIEALVKTRESDVSIAALERQTAKNDLLFLLNRGDFKQEIIPLEKLAADTAEVDLSESLKQAVENRRDYKHIKNELKKNDIDIIVKKNALWPQIDLEATFSRNNLDSGRGGAWGGLGESNDEVFVSLSLQLPLENREARSELRKANLEKKRYLLRFKRLERLILQQLNDKVNQVNTMGNQVKLYEVTVKIHKNKLDKQIKRLKSGRSDSDTLIRYEEDFLEAQLSLARYLFKYRVSLIELDLAKNTLLDKYWREPL